MSVRGWIGITAFCSLTFAYADSPLLPPATHRVASANGKYAAISDPATGTKVIDVASRKQLWSMPNWYRDIYLSNDGQHLATGYDGLNLISGDPDLSLEMITFWEHGRSIRVVSLGTIVPDKSILRRTFSHFAWGNIEGINGRNQLVVIRIDGREFRFNMTTGLAE